MGSPMITREGLQMCLQSTVRHLEETFGKEDDGQDSDPSIDLSSFSTDELAVEPAKNEKTTNFSTPIPNNKKDPVLEELEYIVGEFKKKSNICDKLTNIMLRGLKSSLPDCNFNMFCQGTLPGNWIPIVKINEDNTPYVEFLIKSDVADQDPESQLSDYTMKHILYSKLIVNSLSESTRQVATIRRSASKVSSASSAAPKQLRKSDSLLRQPLQQQLLHQQNSQKSTSFGELNDSKRVNPPRARKFNGSYRQT